MTKFDAFSGFFCAFIALIVLVNIAWAINDLKRGSARFSWWPGDRVMRDEEPFEFWLAVGSKLFMIPFGAFMIAFALGWID